MKKNIAIIMGGYSSEDKISIKSGEVVYKTLSEEKDINLYKVIIKKDEWYHEDKDFTKYEIRKDTFQIIKNDQLISIDLVFNTIHGIPGENGEIQSYLEKIGIHQTSSESYESRITFDKNICKEEIKKIGYLTPKSLIINKNEDYDIEEILSKLKLPIFIKPNAGGSSFGISRVDDKKNIINSINFCFKEDDNALIEEEISGREISVGVIKYKNEIISLPPTEIISHNSFFDYDAKYNGESDEITPADITIEEEKEVRKISLDIYKKLNLKGFSRCDFILRNNLFYFLEVNTNPGLTEESILPQQAIAANISLKDLFRSVIDKYE
ncbi:MAG: D-alanine--D-alanine ligase [Bacteroidota bacterium]|mgnify:FL=1|nr:D-alanine--D-alanine ligase [Bacteroidota bacterium]MEC8702493.1 D-alanine--D-alanine ligase [Bacteroidota bacterium]|tara:strand:- start:2156 stop:3130 length:975 start_codon:yes stop_codon:yes gene_type:complete